MYVKPAPGLIVRDPVTKFPLPAAGREVQPTSYWLRRVAAGDVELTEAPTENPPSEIEESSP